MKERTPPGPRFWAKVDKTDSCWLWTAATNHGGYGVFKAHADTKNGMAHRFAWEDLRGPIPEGLQLDHLCRVRNCVNPAHLEPVTCRENLLRSENQVAARYRQTRCKYGHDLPPQTGVKRECATCRKRHRRQAYLRHGR